MTPTLISVALLATVVIKLTDWFKQLQNKQWNAAATQLAVWVFGIGVLLLTAQTDFASHMVILMPLDKLSFWDAVFVGLAIGSSGALGWQTLANVGGGSHEVATPLFPSLRRKSVPVSDQVAA